jgi:hypothetical protein
MCQAEGLLCQQAAFKMKHPCCRPQVRLRMPVVGSSGSAEAVMEQSGDSRHITVQLPGGGRIHVGPRSSGDRYDSGSVIDVEAEDVRWIYHYGPSH